MPIVLLFVIFSAAHGVDSPLSPGLMRDLLQPMLVSVLRSRSGMPLRRNGVDPSGKHRRNQPGPALAAQAPLPTVRQAGRPAPHPCGSVYVPVSLDSEWLSPLGRVLQSLAT
jgi:hypothetical protein